MYQWQHKRLVCSTNQGMLLSTEIHPKSNMVIIWNFSAKSRTPILIRIQNTIQLSQPNTNGSQVKSRFHNVNKNSSVFNSCFRVLTHFVTIKKNVTMSEASITWPTNFLTGPRPKLTKDKFDLTLCKYLFLVISSDLKGWNRMAKSQTGSSFASENWF